MKAKQQGEKKARKQYSAEFKEQALKRADGGAGPGAGAKPDLRLAAEAAAGGADDGSAEAPASRVGPAEAGTGAAGRGKRLAKKSDGVLREATAVRYGMMRRHEKVHTVAMLCRVLKVSRSGYYDWRHRSSAQAQAHQRLTEDV